MAGATHKARASPRRKPVPVRRPAPASATRPQIASLLRGKGSPQAKLKVGAANDPAEREADVVAARALSASPNAPVPVAQRPSPSIAPLRRSAMDQPSLDTLDETPALPEVAQDVELPKSEDVEIGGLDDAALTEMESGTALQEDAAPATETPQPPEEVQAKAAPRAMGPQGGDASPGLEARIQKPGAGRPLPVSLRRDMEGRFGTSFSDVRLHDNPGARDTAAALGARAFTHGTGIWMGHGDSTDNKALMAHELTHVVQQTGRTSRLMQDGKSGPQPSGQRRLINRFVGDAVLEKIDGYARNLPGYLLLSVLLGKSPVTGKPVARTPGAVIGGLLGLVPGASILVEQLGLAKSMDTAYEWVLGQLAAFDLTWTRVKSVVARAREVFSLLSPIDSLKPVFKPLYDSIVGFARAVKDKVMEFIVQGALKIAGPFGAKVWGILQQAGETLALIFQNPLRFAKNLILAVLKGFGLFFTNILSHLKKGLLGFLFGSLQGLDIELPERLDLKGIFSLLMQIVGLTWRRIRKALVKRLGRRGEKIVAFLEKTVDIIKLLVTKGVIGIWQKVLALIEGLKSTVIGGLIQFVTVSLVKAALGWLGGLSNPVGWIVKIVLIIYDFIVLFLERVQQIMELAGSIFKSIAQVALGKIDAAAKKIEESIGRTIPLVLAFLVAIIPVTGIASKIRKIFDKLRKPVERAIKKLISFLVKKAKKVLAKIIAKLNKGRKLPATTFKIGNKVHKLYAKKKGKKAEIYVKSTEGTSDDKTKDLKAQEAVFRRELKGQELKDVLSFIIAFEKNTDEAEQKGDALDLDSKKAPQGKRLAELKSEIEEAHIELSRYGIVLGKNPRIETEDEKHLLRFKEAVTGFEGASDLYSALSKRKKDEHDGDADQAAKDRRVLELDHNPNLATLNAVQSWLEKRAEGKKHKKLHFAPTDANKLNPKDITKSSFGQLSLRKVGDRGRHLPAMAIYGPINTAMSSMDETRGQDMETFLEDKDLRQITSVKAKLKEQMAQKSGEINDAYAGEAEGLVKNIGAGNRNTALLADKELKLSQGGDGTKETLEGDVSGLARTLNFFGNAKGPDFMKDEGAVGHYSSMRGKKTAAKYLEADHNPMRTEMQTLTGWRLSDIADTALMTGMVHHKSILALPDPHRKAVRSRLHDAMDETVNPKEFTRNMGGAIIVSARVNQNEKMKSADETALARAKAKAQAKLTPTIQNRVVKAAIDERDAAPIARTSMRLGILDEVRQIIHARQERTFNLYASEETKAVREINAEDGKSDQAVGVLAQIAARIRSSSSRTELGTIAEKYFPR